MGTPARQLSSPDRSGHLYGLDSIRFLSALMVVFTHTGLPPIGEFTSLFGPVGKVLSAVYRNLANGQGAVMVFFVVSGICIHLPQVRRGTPNWAVFLVRRYLRLGIPLAAAFALGPLLGSKIFGGTNPVLSVWWSLLAELVYYTLYPALYFAAKRWGWGVIVAISFVLSGIIMAFHPDTLHPARFGLLVNPFVYLPVWLLGCVIAEQIGQERLPVVEGARRWLWRGLMVGSLVASYTLIHHSPLPLPPVRFPASVIAVGVVAWLWIPRELSWCRAHPPPRWLEWSGAWSYSLYLTHLNWFDLWKRGTGSWKWLRPDSWPDTILHTAFILALTIGFYFIVEGPAHQLARRVSQWLDHWLKERTTPPAPAEP